MSINKRVLELRKYLKLNQSLFSKSIRISQSALSQIEKGTISLSFETIRNISVTYNINCNWLINGKGKMIEENIGTNTVNEKFPEYKNQINENILTKMLDKKDNEIEKLSQEIGKLKYINEQLKNK
ncbi:MAG: helix-turn-helix transcriptional regulator [Bacteroidetes bacterium]|nr:helix-turn-helix transcriptional regulator [Bacteroidota bacterium]